MKAVEIKGFGAPEVLVLAERPDPKPGPGEVLVRVSASGVNRPDVLQRKGAYAPPPGASDLPGLEFAGEIVGGDADAMTRAGFKVGDRVCALVAGGGYAQLAVAPVSQCLPVPKGLSDLEAAVCPRPSSPCGPMSSTALACRRARPCWCKAARAASASRRFSLARRSAPR